MGGLNSDTVLYAQLMILTRRVPTRKVPCENTFVNPLPALSSERMIGSAGPPQKPLEPPVTGPAAPGPRYGCVLRIYSPGGRQVDTTPDHQALAGHPRATSETSRHRTVEVEVARPEGAIGPPPWCLRDAYGSRG